MISTNFWFNQDLHLLGLAPMDGVTDLAFRQVVAKYGQPQVMFTEFSNVAGLCHGASALLRNLLYTQQQRPIVAQIFGKHPAYFRQVAILVAQLGFDGLDINMGCPAPKVAGHGGGAGLIKTPHLAQKIIKATQQGIDDWANGQTVADCSDISDDIRAKVTAVHQQLPPKYQQHQAIPVSVKTRIGYAGNELRDWLPVLLEMQPAAISLHGRSLKQAYRGEADWAVIASAADLAAQAQVPLLGNGDVQNYEDALSKIKQAKVAGVLIGRASFGNPWVFLPKQQRQKITVKQKAQLALEHAQLYEQFFQNKEKYSFLPMRKHLAWYIKAIPGAAKLRAALVQTNNSQEVAKILQPLLNN